MPGHWLHPTIALGVFVWCDIAISASQQLQLAPYESERHVDASHPQVRREPERAQILCAACKPGVLKLSLPSVEPVVLRTPSILNLLVDTICKFDYESASPALGAQRWALDYHLTTVTQVIEDGKFTK